MTRISIAALVILGAALVGGARAEIPQGPVTLKSRVTVNDDVVRLGDIFTNVAGKAKIAVAYAPRPGRRTILDVVWLAQLARAYGLPWRARSRFDRVTIERASRQIHRQRIAEEINTALRAKGVEGDYRIRFDNRALAVYLPADATPSLALKDFRFDPEARRFSTLLVAPAEEPTVRVHLTGRVITLTKVPVLSRRMSKGDIIADADIEWIKVESTRVGRNTIIDPRHIKGFTPRRRLAAGKPIRLSDIQRPILVAKGAVVSLMVRTPYMLLTVRARALADGGKGDTVRVMNTRTRKIVHGAVAGSNVVLVEPMGHVTLK